AIRINLGKASSPDRSIKRKDRDSIAGNSRHGRRKFRIDPPAEGPAFRQVHRAFWAHDGVHGPFDSVGGAGYVEGKSNGHRAAATLGGLTPNAKPGVMAGLSRTSRLGFRQRLT